MPSSSATTSPNGRGHAPEVVAPTTRVNIALPFSQFRMQEPSREVAELAAIVDELAAVVQELAPGPKARQARQRAAALQARLR